MSVPALDRSDTTGPHATEPGAAEAVRTVRRGVRRRYLRVAAGLVLLWLGLLAARVLLGDYTVTVPDLVRILRGENIPVASFVVLESKLPRAVAGTLAGLALGVGGAVFQTVLRNPLASPDVVGVGLGASAAAVVTTVWLGLDGSAPALAAVAGGLAVAALVVLLAGRGPGATTRLVLVGIALAAALQALIQWVLLTADAHRAQDALVWLTGSLSDVTWPQIARLAVALVLGLPVVAVLLPRLRVLELGDDVAGALGVPAGPTRAVLMGAAVVLVAVTTAAVGPVAFVALLAGPIARRLVGGRATVALAGLVGACLVVAGDYVGAYLLGGHNLPVGVVTGAAGAPFLLWLLVSARGPKSSEVR